MTSDVDILLRSGRAAHARRRQRRTVVRAVSRAALTAPLGRGPTGARCASHGADRWHGLRAVRPPIVELASPAQAILRSGPRRRWHGRPGYARATPNRPTEHPCPVQGVIAGEKRFRFTVVAGQRRRADAPCRELSVLRSGGRHGKSRGGRGAVASDSTAPCGKRGSPGAAGHRRCSRSDRDRGSCDRAGHCSGCSPCSRRCSRSGGGEQCVTGCRFRFRRPQILRRRCAQHWARRWPRARIVWSRRCDRAAYRAMTLSTSCAGSPQPAEGGTVRRRLPLPEVPPAVTRALARLLRGATLYRSRPGGRDAARPIGERRRPVPGWRLRRCGAGVPVVGGPRTRRFGWVARSRRGALDERR